MSTTPLSPRSPQSAVLSPVEVLGVRVDRLTAAAALARLTAFIESGLPHQVVTVNPEFIIQAQEHPAFREVLRRADLALADGVGLVWAGWLLGAPLPARLPGVDLVETLAALAAERGYRVFLLGAREGIAARAAQVLRGRFPALQVVGVHSGSPAPAEEDEIVERIRAARPHLLFVAYGAPQQDLWIARHLARLEVPVAMGVGGAFNYIAGGARRAPRWMRRLGLEWLHRLVREPWRWRRMLRLPRFAALVLREAARSRLVPVPPQDRARDRNGEECRR
ncbi:MAG: WecB/TagA/CpsF family glycosyltransferase [Chloroflexi bacterium]|nr:WecB/TagA/CpsF family glycosyltransferase [Chloroflexota bacterium]